MENINEKGKIFTPLMKKSKQQALIQTVKDLFSGTIHIHPESRFSEELNRTAKFLLVTDAKLLGAKSQVLAEYPFLAIQVSQIIWITPIGEIKED
jgi:hypothetical protein